MIDFIHSEHLTEREHDELIEALEENTNEFTTLKLIEEVAELQEKLIKYHLKHKDHKPKMEEILDEISDVMLRSLLFVERQNKNGFDADTYLNERYEKKLKKMHGYVKEGKYKKGL